MVSYHKFKFEGYELQIKKGNNKPIPDHTYIITMSAALNCCCNDICKHHINNTANCYGLCYELNRTFMNNTLKRRALDEAAINYLVQNDKAQELANEIIKISNRAKNNKCKFLRWNETGDLKNLDYLLFVNTIADILYKQLGAYSVIYTHRIDIYKQFKANHQQSKGLIILGSDFNANLQFKAVSNPEELKQYKYICCSNCKECHEVHGIAHCYNKNLINKDIIIAELLRQKPIKGYSQELIHEAYNILETAIEAAAGG